MCTDARPTALLVTCEHAGREVPPAYAALFEGADELLSTHRGSDPGAFPVALRLADRLSAPIVFSTVTRLLIDLNRSPDHPGVFSERSRSLPTDARERLLSSHYRPHRECVTRIVADAIAAGRVMLHVGVHSCADVLDGAHRELDIALLFDPDRAPELAFCEAWRRALGERRPDLRFPFNEPYLGKDDGLTTTLRGLFPSDAYLGIEVELRQGFVADEAAQRGAGDLLSDTLGVALASLARGFARA